MDRYIGQGMGKYIEDEIFSATKSLLISSPSISISFGKRLFKMAENGVAIKVITSDKTGTEGDKTNLLAQNFIKPTIPLDYKVVSTKEVAVIHAKIYVIDGNLLNMFQLHEILLRLSRLKTITINYGILIHIIK